MKHNIQNAIDNWNDYLFRLMEFKKYESISMLIDRGFLFPQEIKTNSVLFVGINPSFGKKDDSHEGFKFYPFDSGNLYDDIVYKKEIQYFRKMHNLLKGGLISWSHLDIFCFRETDQKAILRLLDSSEGVEFLKIQAFLFRQIVEIAKPKIIVVCNALARDILNYESGLGSQLGFTYSYKFDDDLGTPVIITEGPLFNTPVFFSSMLSGQRALDRGSFERLGWHIQHVLNNSKI